MGKQLYSQEYEKYIIGIMLLYNDVIDDIKSNIREQYFYFDKNRLLYRKIIELYDNNKCCNILILQQSLPDFDASYIADLTNNIISSSNYMFYVKEVKNLYKERKYLNDIGKINENIENKTIDERLADADNAIMTLVNDVSTVEEDTSQTLCCEFISYVDEAFKNRTDDNFYGYDSGFNSINDILDRIPKEVLWVIGARPSMGKTALAEQIFYNLGSKHIPSAFFSLEMKSKNIIARIVASQTGIKLSKMKKGMLSTAQLGIMQNFLSILYNLPLIMLDTSKRQINKDIDSICSKIRSLAKRGTKIFFIDHLGYITCSYKEKRNEQVGEITKKLADLKNNLGITIILLCQLTRDSEGKEPSLNSLKESGDIEQDADIVSFIHRDRIMEGVDSVPAKLMTEKNRDGRCGISNLIFYPYITKFADEVKNVQETPYGNKQL
jgi:replicative DNA helicase